jgi:hypothetical protein
MRTFVLFALSLAGTAILTDDASAIGRRKRGGSAAASSCCGGAVGYGGYGTSGAAYGGGYGAAASPCCGGSVAYSNGYGGYPASSSSWLPTGATNGMETMIRATDGQIYTLGSDGKYWASSGTTMGGFPSQYTGYFGSYPASYPAPPTTEPAATVRTTRRVA